MNTFAVFSSLGLLTILRLVIRQLWEEHVFDIIGSVLTFAALFLAVRQYRDARKHTKKLEDIYGSVSTRYLGPFPSYLPQIANTIKNAKSDIVILCHFPAYGCFTSPSGWLLCRHAIESKLNEGKASVTFLCQSESARKNQIKKLYSQEWLDRLKKSNPRYKNRIAQFINQLGADDDPKTVTLERLVELRNTEDNVVLERTFRGANVVVIEDYSPILFWIADGNQAIFAFPGYSDLSIEHGFTTTDPKLLQAFMDIKGRYEATAQGGSQLSNTHN